MPCSQKKTHTLEYESALIQFCEWNLLISAPWIKDALSEARNKMAFEISSGSPKRLSGIERARTDSNCAHPHFTDDSISQPSAARRVDRSGS
jgi:hypothetical protein